MTQLLLDFDGPVLPHNLIGQILGNCRRWSWPVRLLRCDRTRHGWHVIVTIARRLSPPMIVAAQAILGSDRKREAFNLMRVQHLRALPAFWRTRWNVLYSVHLHGETR